MKIIDLCKSRRPLLSLEIFPPVRDSDLASVYRTAQGLATLAPDFISVTYGAGGKGNKNTAAIATAIKKRQRVETVAHLTCLGSSRETVAANLRLLQAGGIENVLALRGDLPREATSAQLPYRYAVDLIREIKAENSFCIGAAAYPECHIECQDPAQDLEHLKQKVAAGADFLVTQLFFDNATFYRFRQRATKLGIGCPILTGVMPILSKKQVNKLIYMCGASLPAKVVRLLVKYSDDPVALRQAGIEYAANQIADLLANGVDGVHIYTMNQAGIARGILDQLPGLGGALPKEHCSSGI